MQNLEDRSYTRRVNTQNAVMKENVSLHAFSEIPAL